MKIANIRFRPLALAFEEPYHWAGRVDYGATNVLVEIETDEGITGYGVSTAGRPAESTLQALEGVVPLFAGRSPFDIERLTWEARFLGSFNHSPRFAALTLAGVEMALWDVAGKACGRPLYQLMGGAYREDVDYFAFLQGDTADELAEDARRAVQAGFSVIYMKVGRGEPKDLENTEAVRAVIGDRKLRLDANEAWDVGTAIRMIGRLSRFEPEWVEQPTPGESLPALRQVKEAVTVPIAADQAVFSLQDVYEVCRTKAADVIVLSFHETGGLLAFKKAAAVAQAAGIVLCLHGQSSTGMTDCAQHQVGLTIPNLTDGNQIMHQLLRQDVLAGPDLSLRHGRLGRLEAPGLGFELDWEAVERAEALYRQDPHYHHA
ncbi:MAG: mandelate racemase/muconate lactonizing enzyme family protein [Thermoleophilia bacterium]|nr:mandelate racemase/muconate lactonizing enzyme family protein [Thermoleophilia bacterium]